MLAFRTRYGLFEPTVMQFGTTNAPAHFQGYINITIWEALDDFPSPYLDNISIYSDSEEEHEEHLYSILQSLLEAGLHFKPDECKFHKETVRYFGLIVSLKGISMEEDMVEIVNNGRWEKKPTNGRLYNLIKAKEFLLFCNSY